MEKDGTPLSFCSFQESVQSVLNNAKDWNVKGSARKKCKKLIYLIHIIIYTIYIKIFP